VKETELTDYFLAVCYMSINKLVKEPVEKYILSIFSTAYYPICTITAPAVRGRKATCMPR